jgi:hypothetical protein
MIWCWCWLFVHSFNGTGKVDELDLGWDGMVKLQFGREMKYGAKERGGEGNGVEV